MVCEFKKESFQVRMSYISIMISVLAFFFIPQTLFAADIIEKSDLSTLESRSSFDPKKVENKLKKESIFEKGYNIFYQFVDNNEYLFAPISGTSAGMILCGFWCAVGGGVAGSLDELSIYFGYTDKRYLTWGMFGATTGHVINPVSLVSEVAGAVVGVLIPTGILNDHQEFIAPVVSIISGNSIGGTKGIVSVGTAGAVDEILLNNGVIDKHYLTFCTAGAATVNLLGLGLNPLIAYPIGAVLGLIAASYEEEIVANLLSPMKTAGSLYEAYGKFIPKEQLDEHIEKHVLVLLGSQFLTQFLSLKVLGYQQNLVYNFERLDNPAGPAWNNFKTEMTNFAIFLFPYVVGQTFSKNIDHYFNKKLHVALEDQIRTELFFGETALRLSHDQNSTVLIDSLKNDISTVVNSGSGLVTSAISTSVGGAYGFGIIIVHSPNIFVYSVLYNKAKTLVADYLASQHKSYGEEIREIDSIFITTLKHDTENIRTITERDGLEATKEKIHQLSSDLRDLEGKQRLWGMMGDLWKSVSEMVDYVVNCFWVGREVNYGRIPFVDRNTVRMASWRTSRLLSWTGNQAQTISEVEQSLDRVIILEGKLHILPQGIGHIDQVNRLTKEGNQLIFQDLEIGVGNRILVKIDDLKLDMGKTYAITGKTGCGKTSLLSKIKGIKENGVFGKGYIYYPEIEEKTPKIVMLSQQDYFPLNSSLYEIISYPSKIHSNPELESKEREEISLLLQEIDLYAFNANNDLDVDVAMDIDVDANNNTKIWRDEDDGICNQDEEERRENVDVCFINPVDYLDLDSKKDWYTYLSGGEKKKVMIVSAIIKKPDILILDEIFNGLDPASIIAVQQILKKYLPNTLILSVDHHSKDNNYNSFYDNELHIFDQKVFLF